MKRSILLVISFLCFASAHLASAAIFNPTTAAQLQANLNTAATNNQANVVNLAEGVTYSTADNGGLPFTYVDAQGNSLLIQGKGRGSSTLSGANASAVLNIQASSATPGNVTLAGMTIRSGNDLLNTAAAGVQVVSALGDTFIDDVEFADNQGNFYGGLFVLAGSGDITVTNSSFARNSGTVFYGGMLLVTSSGQALVDGNEFLDNTGGFDGAGLVTSARTSLTQNRIEGNTGTAFNGGITAVANSADPNFGDLTVDRNTFSRNQGQTGGGTFTSSGKGVFTNNTFDRNLGSSLQGGARVETSAGNLLFENNIFSNNQVSDTASSVPQGVGAFVKGSATLDVVNNTFYNNAILNPATGSSAGGLYVSLENNIAQLNLYNNLMFQNAALAGSGSDFFLSYFMAAPNATLRVYNNNFAELCFTQNAATNSCDTTLLANQADNLNIDPLFIDAANGNFQLGAGSPAIDAGDVATPSLLEADHDGAARVVNDRVDIGALEAQVDVDIDPATLDFGVVELGQSSVRTLTILGKGSIPAQISDINLSDTTNFSLDVNGGTNPCGSENFSLGVGESCTVNIVFGPTAVGSYEKAVIVVSDDPDEGSLTARLSGVGVQGGGVDGDEDIFGGGCALQPTTAPASTYAWVFLGILGLGLWVRRQL